MDAPTTESREPRTRIIKISLTETEHADVRAAADAEGLDVATYVRRCAVVAARAEKGGAR